MAWLPMKLFLSLFKAKPAMDRPPPKIHAVPPGGLKKTKSHGLKTFDAFS
jgi:hypothetical protein